MPFQSRTFQLAKDPERPEENQDALAMNRTSGLAVIADGVSSAIFSRQWATILTEAVLADPPDPADPATFSLWLAQRRQQWAEQIDVTGLAWFQKAKLPTGAFSTLLWIHTLPVEQPEEGAFGAWRLFGRAVGDSCLLHVRHGEILRTFPIQTAAELEANPVVLGSVDLGRDPQVEFHALDELCYADDLIVLCTDAIADWALRRIESGNPPDWDTYWDMSPSQWEAEIAALRQDRQMRYDDATLMLLRVVADAADVEPAQETPVEAQPVADETQPVADETQPVADETQPVADETQPVADETQPVADGTPLEDDDWREKFKTASEQFAEGVEQASGQMINRLKKWKDKAVEKYREKFGSDEK